MVAHIGELLASRTEQWPDKILLIAEREGGTFTYREFHRRVTQTAHFLHRLGVDKGDIVSLWLPNCTEFLLFYFACWTLGAIAGPINAHLKGPEVRYILNHSEARFLVTQADYWPTVESIRRDVNVERVILTDAHVDGTIDYRSEVERLSPVIPSTTINPDDEAIIIYTSGTTGRPKGVLLTHRNLMVNARQIADWLHFTPEDRFLCIMPLFHMNAVAVTTLTPLTVGASIVLSPKFSVRRHWSLIAEYGVTTFGSVATMLSMLLNAYPAGIPEGLDTRRLKFALCGSAPVPVPVMEEFENRFNCPVIEGYGLSECTCRATFNPPDERRRLGSVGLPIGNEMKIFDDEDRELPPGEIGEIVLRGENVMKGYFKNPEATRRAFRHGWFHTGDLGYRDEDGFFYVVDRKSDMIIRGGENIYPREIDEVLYQHPAVREAATVGVPDELYGEAVKAFVVLKEGVDCRPEELMAFCRARLADYKCPTLIEFIDEIPKGPTGKLLKRELLNRS